MKTAEEAAKDRYPMPANPKGWLKCESRREAYIAGFESGKTEGFESRQGEVNQLQAFKDFAEDAVKTGKPFRMFDVLLTPTATNS